jgi:glycosyltransferase involved in cell wall biosynthesis
MTISVSILMPMRNAQAYIQETVASILRQSFSSFEIIIVNDGSSDNCQALVEDFADSRINIIQGKCNGISSALNLALSKATGEYICRCDADDLFPVDRLLTQVKWLKENENYIAVAGQFNIIDEKSLVVADINAKADDGDITDELLWGKVRTHLGTFLIKNEVIRKLKGFREFFITAEDIDMQLRLAESGNIGFVTEKFYSYRIHSASITHEQSSNKREFYEQMAYEFLKQRLTGGIDQLDSGNPPLVALNGNKPRDSRKQIVGYLIGESWRLHANKQKNQALKISLRACMKKPFYWLVWKNILMILVK